MCKQRRWVKLRHIYKTGRNCNTADPPHSWVCTLQFCLFMEKLWWQHLCIVVWSPHSFIFTLVIELCTRIQYSRFSLPIIMFQSIAVHPKKHTKFQPKNTTLLLQLFMQGITATFKSSNLCHSIDDRNDFSTYPK